MASVLSIPQPYDFRNDSGETIPPYGLILCKEIVKRKSDQVLFLKAEKPVHADANHLYRNGMVEVAPDGFGACYLGDIIEVAYDPQDGTPAVGEFWGIKEGEEETFLLRKGYGFFQVLYAPTDAQRTNVLVRRAACNRWYRVVIHTAAEPLKKFDVKLSEPTEPPDGWDPDDPDSEDADLWTETDIIIKDVRYGMPSDDSLAVGTVGWILVDYYGRPVLMMAECQ